MTALDIISWIQYIGMVVLAIECAYIFFNMNSKQQSYLFMFCFCAFLNNVAYTFEMHAQTYNEGFHATQFAYFGKVWIPVAFFAVTMQICEIPISKKVYAVLVSIHMTIFFLVFSSEHHTLYYGEKREFVQTGLFPHNKYESGIVHTLYFTLLVVYILIGVVVSIWKYMRVQSREQRVAIRYVFASIIAMTIGYMLFLLKLTGGYDSTAMSYAVASVIMFFALFRANLLENLSFVRDYAIDTIPEGVVAVNEVGSMVYCNASMKKIFPDIVENPQDTVKRIEDSVAMDKVIEQGGCIYETAFKPLEQEKHKKGNLYVVTDVTENYRHMEQLQEQKTIAEEANASKSTFLSIVTHEIRTPMSAVVGMTDLLLREPEHLNSKQEKYLRNIKNSGAALVMIVNDILDQSKIEAGKMEIIEDSYALRPMVEDVRMIIENRIGSRPIRLICDIDEEIPEYLIGDSLRIRQILINLLNNAVKFTEEGHIRLYIEHKQTEGKNCKLRFSVRDTGQGIKEEDLSKLGQAFMQVNTKVNHGKEGTGLGLSISRDFISMMGGQLEVDSVYGEGTEFFFEIMQEIADGIEHEGAIISKQAWQEEEQFLAPEARVLIVDDTELNLMITSELIQPLGVQVDTASSGEIAIEMVKQKEYHVIFMDYMMPYMDGVETTINIRAEAKLHKDDEERAKYFHSVPIIALSGDSSKESKEKFLHAGMNDFTEKPVELKRLKKKLLKWLPEELIQPVEDK